jgi:hypothetical protein
MAAQGQPFANLVVVRSNEAQESMPEPGLARKVSAYNDKLLLVEHRMQKGWAGAVHSHLHQKIVYVVRGGVSRGASAIEESLVADIFTPFGEDYSDHAAGGISFTD